MYLVQFITLSLFLLCLQPAKAQSVLTSDGGFNSGTQGSLSWTLGEPVSETVNSSTGILTQGFQQNYEELMNLAEVNSDALIGIYPNPCSSTLHLQFNKSALVDVKIYDQQGRLLTVSEINLQSGVKTCTLDVGELADGTYILHLYLKGYSKSINKRFIKIENE